MIGSNIERQKKTINPISRREWLMNSVTFAMVSMLSRGTHAAILAPARGRSLVYVGTYTSPVDGSGNGKGIYLFEMNVATGELHLVKVAAETHNPSWLSLDSSGRYLYAVNEVSDFEGNCGSVSAFAVNRLNGNLELLNVVSSGGAAPAYLSVDLVGKYVFVANHGGGSIAVLPILPTGAIGSATYVHRDQDSVGRTVASSAPPRSFAFSGHDKTHAHMIRMAPGNRFVLYTDLGQDRIYVDRFDAKTGKLAPVSDSPFVSLPSGDGPRQFVFHSNGHWLYSLQEEASTVAFFIFDTATGSLQLRQTISTLPPGFAGTSFASEKLLSPDGRFLYAANRLHNTIAAFSISRDGRLTYLGDTPTLGDYPRQLNIDPSRRFFYVRNQRSDDITCFRVDQKTGLLTFNGQYAPVGSPACITFLA